MKISVLPTIASNNPMDSEPIIRFYRNRSDDRLKDFSDSEDFDQFGLEELKIDRPDSAMDSIDVDFHTKSGK